MQKSNCNCDDTERTIKNIYVFLNGAKYDGQKIVLSQNRWHHILNQITFKLNPYFGKVDKLYTTTSGLTVYSFTDLENNATYVASNKTNKYSPVKGGYTLDTSPSTEYFEHYLSSQLQRVNKYKKLVYVRRDLLVIYIFRNGECKQSFKIVLTNDDLSSWNHILSYVAMILDVPERCIKSLYSINGSQICGPWELQHGASYVAVGYNETFKKGCYRALQRSTEVTLTGYPVVPKDKNLPCVHRVRRKMEPLFRWDHYDQDNDGAGKKCTHICRSAETCKEDTEEKPRKVCKRPDPRVSCKKPEPIIVEAARTSEASTRKSSNKKVTVHMRIKNSKASNVTITRNSGDTSKKWDTSSSSGTEEQNYSSKIVPKFSKSCLKICPKYSKPPKVKPCKRCSSGSSSSSREHHTKTKSKSLKWKHVKKEPSDISQEGKVTVKVKGGKAIILDGSSSQTKVKPQDKISETCTAILKKILDRKEACQRAKQQDCSKTCEDRKQCKTYRISKPKSICPQEPCEIRKPPKNTCPQTPCGVRHKSKEKSYSTSCQTPTKKSYLERIKSFLSESISSADSSKRKCRRCKKHAEVEEEEEPVCERRRGKCEKVTKPKDCGKPKCEHSSKRTSKSTSKRTSRSKSEASSSKRSSSKPSKSSRNISECTICRIQHEYKRINKRY